MIDLPIRTDGLVVLCLYMAGCLLAGAAGFVAKRSARDTSVEDHFLAGSSGLPAPVLLGTVFAQTLSGWALLGYPGAAYREGLGAIKWLPASVCIGVGMAVVCALSESLTATSRREGFEWTQEFSRGKAKGKLKKGELKEGKLKEGKLKEGELKPYIPNSYRNVEKLW